MIDFPDVPHTSPPARPPPQLPSTDDQPQQPVSKSDRFAEDFDRSWPPRRSGGGDDARSKDNTNEKVLFNASSNRLESRPEQQSTRLDTGKSGEKERPWGPKLLGRETGDVGSASASGLGGKRSLPPHLSVSDAPSPSPFGTAGEGPSAASGSWRSSAPARPAWSGSRPTPSSGAGGGGGGGRMGEQRQSWESRNDERERERERERAVGLGSGISGQGRRSFNAGQPPRSLYTHPPPHTLPHPHATSTAAPLAPASSTSTDPDPQSLEMHTAAEKARLRRLEEEKEREAAKERARMKAKALEEKLKAAQPESQQQQQQQQQQLQLTIARREGVPLRTTSSEVDKPSRAESEPSWRARAQPPPPPVPAAASSQETPRLPSSSSSSSSFVRGERTEEEKEEKVMIPLDDAAGLGASSSPSLENAQQPTSSSSAATATATATAQQQPALSSSSFDGMLARVKAAMLEMQQTREKEVREKELEKEREKEAVKQVQVEEKVPAKEEVEKRHVLKASRAEQVKEEKTKPVTTTTTPKATTPKATSTSQTPNQTSQPPSSKLPTVSAPAAEYEPPQFFDITYPQPPRSPPPAWRTYNIRLPKPSSLPRPRCFDLPAISSTQQTKWEKGVAAPKGWARTFEPPLEDEETIEDVLDRAKMLLPQSRVVTKVGEIVVSISPTVLERVKERRTGVDGEIKEGREKRRAEKVGRSVVEEEGEGEEEVRTGVEKAAVLLESSTKPVQAPAPVPPTTTSSTTQQQQQPPPRRKSPVKSAAQAEKDPSTFILQGVGLAIAPPPHISLSSLPASSVSGSTSRDGKDGSFSLLSDDGKPGVRFMVSSELEGDSLLEEVNKMSLESVEEAKGEKNDDKDSEVCRTHPLLLCKM